MSHYTGMRYQSVRAAVRFTEPMTLLMPRPTSPSTTMIEQVARAIAKADGAQFEDDPARFTKLALAALKPLARPTEAMVDAAHAAVEFDDHWAINSRRDFRKSVREMIRAAMEGR